MKSMTLAKAISAISLVVAMTLGAGQPLAASSEIVPQPAVAPEEPGGGGPGGGGPGGGGGGGPPGTGDLYGDLYVIDRDENGVPILYLWEDMDADGYLEPVAGDTGYTNPVTKGIVDPALLGLDWEQCHVAVVESGCLIPLNEEGEVAESDGFLVQEVEFGRLNIGRSPEKVLKTQLADVMATLADSESPLKLDPSGRLVATLEGEETTVDSPLQNLALYQEHLENGVLDEPTGGVIALPMPFPGAGFLDSTAPWLGVAGDKGGKIDVDLLVYLNAILRIPNDTNQPAILGPDGKLYFDFSDYSYDRQRTYPGCVTYFVIADGTATLIQDRPILNAALGTGYDVVIDFGESIGLWNRMNNSLWALLHSVSPELLATGDLDGNGKDDVLVGFGSDAVSGPSGLWRRMNNSVWVKLHDLSPELLATGDLDGNGQDDAVIDFGPAEGLWIWMNNGAWVKLHDLSPELLATGDLDGNGQDDVLVDFGPAMAGQPSGLWRRMNNSTWVPLYVMSPEVMATGDLDGNGQDDAVIDFGPAKGLWNWMNNSTWVKMYDMSPELLAIGDLDGNGQDDAVIDFGPAKGLWNRMNNSTWVKLYNMSPELLVTADLDGNGKDDAVIDFGPAKGLWNRMNNSTWVKLHNLSPEFLATGDLDGSMGYARNNVAGFAQAADDARAVNAFVHDNVVVMADSMGSSALCP